MVRNQLRVNLPPPLGLIVWSKTCTPPLKPIWRPGSSPPGDLWGVLNREMHSALGHPWSAQVPRASRVSAQSGSKSSKGQSQALRDSQSQSQGSPTQNHALLKEARSRHSSTSKVFSKLCEEGLSRRIHSWVQNPRQACPT